MATEPPKPPPLVRAIMGVFGFAFAGIGISVLVSLWTVSGFHAPPLIFKVVGSFIALVFVVMGGGMAISMIKGKGLAGSQRLHARTSQATGPAGYTCSSCGATLKEGEEVSPLGDVKCTYCGNWFNVHGKNQ